MSTPVLTLSTIIVLDSDIFNRLFSLSKFTKSQDSSYSEIPGLS